VQALIFSYLNTEESYFNLDSSPHLRILARESSARRPYNPSLIKNKTEAAWRRAL